jgi:hypothetical protein
MLFNGARFITSKNIYNLLIFKRGGLSFTKTLSPFNNYDRQVPYF